MKEASEDFESLGVVLQKYRQEVKRLRSLTQQDELTGVGNARAYQKRLESAVALARSNGWPLAVALVSIDRLQHINAQFGDAVGDRALRLVASAISEHQPSGSYCARLTGNQFGLVIPAADATRTLGCCEKLRTALGRLTLCERQLTVSIGVAHMTLLYFVESATPSLLTWAAQRALQMAQSQGGDCVVIDN